MKYPETIEVNLKMEHLIDLIRGRTVKIHDGLRVVIRPWDQDLITMTRKEFREELRNASGVYDIVERD